MNAILACVSLLEGLLLGLSPFPLFLFFTLAWFVLRRAVRELRSLDFQQDRLLLIASAGLAGLFCAMLPLTWLTDRDQFYNAARGLGFTGGLLRGINWLDNLLTVALTFALVFLLVAAFWHMVAHRNQCADPTPTSQKSGWTAILLYSSPCLLAWFGFLAAFWPGIMLPDSYTQWRMAHGLLPLSDAHPITHTLIEAGLWRLWDNPAAVAIFQVLAMALAWGWAMSFFETRGIPRKVLLPLSVGFALLPYNGIQLVTLLKDELYMVVVFCLVVLLGKVWVSDGAYLKQSRHQLALGLFLALPYLMRHNGLFILISIPPALLIFYRPAWKAVALSGLLSVIFVVGLRDGLAFRLIKVEQSPGAVMFVVPIQHISAVGFYGGDYTPEQAQVLQQIAPVETWRSAYKPYFADSLSKPWGATKDEKVTEKIEQARSGLLRTFTQLALKYPLVVIRSELDLMSTLWRFNLPEKERPWFYEYSLVSHLPPSGLDSSRFAHPNQGTPLNAALTAYLRWSNGPAVYAILWQGGLYLFVSLALLVILFFARGKRSLTLFLPTLANVLSLAVSMPVQSFRYIYPIVACVPLLVLFAFIRRDGR